MWMEKNNEDRQGLGWGWIISSFGWGGAGPKFFLHHPDSLGSINYNPGQ